MRLALYQPDMAQNLGAAIRVAACFAVDLDIIEPCGFALTDKALRRVAMDYGEQARVTRHTGFDAFLADPARAAEPASAAVPLQVRRRREDRVRP